MKILNYINGSLVEPIGGDWLDNINPATGQKYGVLPDSRAVDIQEAVKAASAAFPEWSALTQTQRSNYLLKIADLPL